MQAMRVGVVGCGAVSRMYLPILARVADVQVVALADVDSGVARERAGEYEIGAVCTPDELITDPAIELVLNLTPIPVHAQISQAALAAGKHVYSEKPLASTVADATALVDQARAAGLALGCAPDTLLGTGFQAAREALADNAIGRPLAANGFMFRSSIDPASPYASGANPFLDMAPYYLSALISLFGPIRRVSAGATENERAAMGDGVPIAVSGVLEFVSGLMADVLLAWGTGYRHEVPDLTVYGTDGVLRAPNPNNFGDPAFVRAHGELDWRELAGSRQPQEWPANLRGLGVGEMVHAIRAGRPPVANGELACHVVDAITGLVRSASSGERVELTTTAPAVPPMPSQLRADLIG